MTFLFGHLGGMHPTQLIYFLFDVIYSNHSFSYKFQELHSKTVLSTQQCLCSQFPWKPVGNHTILTPARNTAVLQQFVAQAWSYLIGTSSKKQTPSQEANTSVNKTTEYVAHQCWQLARLELIPSLHLVTLMSTVGNFLLLIPWLSKAVLFS